MNSLKKLSAFAILFLAFGFTACSDVEPLDPAIVLNPNPSNPSNPSNPGTSTGDYWPAALNNSWTFKDEGIVQPPIKIVSINSIGGNTYYTFNQAFGSTNQLSGTATTRMRKSGGDYYYKMEDLVIAPAGGALGITMTGFETIILKDNIAAGASWSGNYSQTVTYSDPQFPAVTTNTSYVSTIMEKDTTVVVLGETYPNVIKVKMVQTTQYEGVPTSATTYYWFAKNVGPVKYSIEDDGEMHDSELFQFVIN